MTTPDNSSATAAAHPDVQYRYAPVPHTKVTFADGFWAPRLASNRERTIGHIYRQLEETGRLDAFKPGWNPGPEIKRQGISVLFWDSDTAKWIEAASYSLATQPDPALDALLDDVIGLLARAQQPDGYLNTWFTAVEPEKRWTNLRDWHEMYNAGHLIEAAVAHYWATGKRSLLDVVCRYANYIATVFGRGETQKRGYPGHPEIELALVKLFHATGERRYLELSRYFVEERGRQPHYYDQEARERGEDPKAYWARGYAYSQSHAPIYEQHEVIGHAVRAVYLYSAMADLAAEDGNRGLFEVCERLWRHLTTRRMYVMGGIGTSKTNEGFTSDYDLPNESAYAETCAAIGLIFWAQRMLQIDLDRRYSDILELALYNAVISGVSLDGQTFFYDNPLASDGTHHRQPWFTCPCCPPNVARLLASLGQYVYAQSATDAVVHLYVQGAGQFQLGDQTMTLQQETRYPWDGAVTMRVKLDRPASFGLRVRLPGWCDAPNVAVSGAPVDVARAEQGYLRIEREWQDGDYVTLDLPMSVERVYAHPAVAADIGKVALQRGPIVYCLEQVDHAVPLSYLVLPQAAELQHRFEPDLLGGIVCITGAAVALDDADWNDTLYRNIPPSTQPSTLTAIPYYAWDHRAPGAMQVWIRSGAPAQD